MYAPLAALSAGATGFTQGLKEADERRERQRKAQLADWEMQGVEALGKAFSDVGPQPPAPGQPSVPNAPASPPMSPGGMSAQASPLDTAEWPAGPVGAPGSAQSSPAMTGAEAPPAVALPSSSQRTTAGGLPQLDLQTLTQRVRARNPNLPPQALMAALTRGEPLLSAQGRMELARMQAQMQQERMGETARHNRALERKWGPGGDEASSAGARPQGLMSQEAIDAAAERYLKSGQLPPNMGRGVQGRTDMAAIQNRAAEMAKERGISAAGMPKSWQTFRAEQTAMTRFLSGPQGNTIRSLNVVVDHLGTMQQLADALKNGDVKAFNRLAQYWAEQTGVEAPTNFDTAKQIVGSEVIKSLGVAGAGTMAERKEAADAFNRAKSPEQIAGAINVAQRLLTGQIRGLRKQFKTATGLPESKFDEMMLPETLKFLGGEGGAGPGAAPSAPAAGGWSVQEIK